VRGKLKLMVTDGDSEIRANTAGIRLQPTRSICFSQQHKHARPAAARNVGKCVCAVTVPLTTEKRVRSCAATSSKACTTRGTEKRCSCKPAASENATATAKGFHPDHCTMRWKYALIEVRCCVKSCETSSVKLHASESRCRKHQAKSGYSIFPA